VSNTGKAYCALHRGIFEQPAENDFFSKPLGPKSPLVPARQSAAFRHAGVGVDAGEGGFNGYFYQLFRQLSRRIQESSEKPPFALLMTQISKKDYTDFSLISLHF